METVTVRLLGKTQLMVFGKWMLPGETRQLHPAQVEQLEAWYPGRFARVGAIEETTAEAFEPEPAVIELESEPEPEPTAVEILVVEDETPEPVSAETPEPAKPARKPAKPKAQK